MADEGADRFAWLSAVAESTAVAGCITVAAGLAPAALADAVGADVAHSEDGEGDLPPGGGGLWLGLSETKTGAVGFESNGFQGSRPEVLTEASRAGGQLAASLFWNVDGQIEVAFARRGKLVAAFEMGDGDIEGALPRSVRRWIHAMVTPNADLLAIGGAMIHAFSGVELTTLHVTPNVWAPITPRDENLPTYSVSSLRRWVKGPWPDQIDRAGSASWRPISQWAATAAVELAQLSEHPAVLSVTTQYDEVPCASMTIDAVLLERTLDREADQAGDALENLLNYSEEQDGLSSAEAASRTAGCRWLSLRALHYSCHPDELTAALGAVYELWRAVDLADLDWTTFAVEIENRSR